MGQIDPSEPALAQESEDRVTPDLRGIAVREDSLEPSSGGCEPSVSDRFFVSSIARSLTSTDLIHDCQPKAIVSS